MANSPEQPVGATNEVPRQPAPPPTRPAAERPRVHEVRFIAYPKLLFAWPLILAGYVLYPFAGSPAAPDQVGAEVAAVQPSNVPVSDPGPPPEPVTVRQVSGRLEVIGWIYIWIMLLVLLTLGVDVDRNQAIFLGVLILLIYFLGLWLRDTQHFTVFGDIYRWFTSLDVQYDRRFGFALSVLFTIPYVLMLIMARLNDRWRITHNEFEHYSFGKMSDSLGRGAKTIRTDYPDVLEAVLGLAGTLTVFNSSGTRELRRISHVPLLPFVGSRLGKILETTSVTAGQTEDEDEDEQV